MMMSWCLMSSDVSWHIRDKIWPMPKHGSINLYTICVTDSPGRPPRLSHSSWTTPSSEGDDLFYTALFSALEQTHWAFVACDSKRLAVAFYNAFWTFTEVVYLQRCLVLTWLVPRETAAVWARSVYTIQPENSPAAPAGTRTRDLSITRPGL